MTQGSVLFCQILQFVVIQVAAQSYRGQEEDLPIIKHSTPTVLLCVSVDILLDKPQNLVTQGHVGVEVMQAYKIGIISSRQLRFNLPENYP